MDMDMDKANGISPHEEFHRLLLQLQHQHPLV